MRVAKVYYVSLAFYAFHDRSTEMSVDARVVFTPRELQTIYRVDGRHKSIGTMRDPVPRPLIGYRRWNPDIRPGIADGIVVMIIAVKLTGIMAARNGNLTSVT